MKKLLPYLFITAVLFLAQSCSKGILEPDGRNVRGSDITGSWVLSETADYSGSGWRYYNTGLERGVFTFYNNGAAAYDDGYSQMTGGWGIFTSSEGYYDQYGRYRNDLHQAFRINVEDRFTNNSINLQFDNIEVSFNRLIATSYDGRTISRYIFIRY